LVSSADFLVGEFRVVSYNLGIPAKPDGRAMPEENVMSSVSLQEAQANLASLLHQLIPGEELVIMENNHPLARIVRTEKAQSGRKLGTLQGTVLYIAEDFDAPLDDFREYME
jgi:antitoxin (DNA-binding transcriptional repressor) of toxin-antitoxin stability system